MEGQLQEMIPQLSDIGPSDSTLELDAESRRRLESLGYVGGDSVDETFTFDRTKTDPKDLIEYYEYAQRVVYLISYEKYDKAFEVCDKMITGWPQIPNTYFILAQVASAANKPVKVIEYGSRYLALTQETAEQDSGGSGLDPGKPVAMAHSLVAKAAYELEDFELAAEHWTEAMQLVKSDWPEALNELGAASFQLGKIDEAIKCWVKALRVQPEWPEVHNNLAGAYYKQGKIEQAVKHWTEALRLKPDWDDVRENLDKLALQKKKRDRTVAEYIEMLHQNPDDSNTHNALATELYRQGKIEDAITHWLEAAKQKPNWAEVQNSLGTAFYRQGKNKKAAECWSEAIGLKPDWAEPHNNLAWLLATAEDDKLRDLSEAVRLAERACELTGSENPNMLDTLGVAYAAAGRFDEALKTAGKAKELAENSGQEKLVADIEKHIEFYKLGRPWH
jgi:tetratricopeptide (TPR) repeat protein